MSIFLLAYTLHALGAMPTTFHMDHNVFNQYK